MHNKIQSDETGRSSCIYLVSSDLLLGIDEPVRPGNIFLRGRRSESRKVLRLGLGIEAGDESLEECAPIRRRGDVVTTLVPFNTRAFVCVDEHLRPLPADYNVGAPGDMKDWCLQLLCTVVESGEGHVEGFLFINEE